MASTSVQDEYLSNVEVKMHKMCRTCLVEEKDMHSIFENSNFDNITYNLIISAITGITVLESDGLPLLICKTCKQTASHAYQFKQQSVKADVTLRNLIFKKKPIILEQDDKKISLSGHTDLIIKYEKFDFNNEDAFDAEFDPSDFDISAADDFCIIEDTKKIPKKEVELTPENFCTLCNTTFPSETHLRMHLLSCVKVECDDEKSSYCPLCVESFEDAQALLKHVWTTHNEVMDHKKRGRPKKEKNKKSASVKKTKKSVSSKKIKSSSGKVTNLKIVNKMGVKFERTSRSCTRAEYPKEEEVKPRCGICSSSFSTQKELDVHIKIHKDTQVLCCDLCDRSFLELVFFKRHFIVHHPDIKNVEENTLDGCRSDEMHSTLSNYVKASSVEEMIKESTAPGDDSTEENRVTFVQVCSLCGRLFFSLLDFMQHNDTEHPDFSHRCNLCLKIFTTIKSAARHRKLCEQTECKYECGSCGMKFAYEMSLNKHILRSHKGQSVSVNFINPKYKDKEKRFFCDVCSKGFYRKDLLDKHVKIHMPNEKIYECDICHKKFNRKDNLRSHTRTHDPNRIKSPNSCLCLYCGRSFSNSSNLIVHMRRHTGEKPYKCDFCGKGFPRSSDLQVHRRMHTGERPCICGVCGKGFSRSNKLSRHMRVHTGQRPYKCTYCEKAFSQSNDLTLHIRRHTGDKPYVCEICGDRFIQGTALQNHRRSHGHFPPAASHQPIPVHQVKQIHSELTADTATKITLITKL